VQVSEISNLPNPSTLRKNFTAPDFPADMFISADGLFQGTPKIANHPWNINFTVTDNNKISKNKSLAYKAGTVGIEENQLPISELSQNYPNPFNPTTTISFNNNLTGNIKLTVLNAKGEVVSQLVNAKLTAGNHRYNFNGAGLNSGVYFYKLETPAGSVVKKMLMVK